MDVENLTQMTYSWASVSIVKPNYAHAEMPLIFASMMVAIIVFKGVYCSFPRIHSYLSVPDSSVMLMTGFLVGVALHYAMPEQEFRLEPDWFFWVLLPMIVLDAGYFVPNEEFIENIVPVTTFAVFGTLFNIILTSGFISVLKISFGVFPSSLSFTDILIFATIISAVDPVAVISVFEEIHVNRQLYILVFGESLLNDATTIVFYNTFQQVSFIGAENLRIMDLVFCGVSFCVVSLGGILIGVLFGALTGFVTKITSRVQLYEPVLCLLLPYIAYGVAEAMGVSGILALTFCGLAMKKYLVANMEESTLISFNYVLKTLSSFCETVIFVLLGVSTVSRNHWLDINFVLATFFACFVFRFLSVFSMTYLMNKYRMKKISLVDQFVIAYGGIRGAVCYGLVVSLDSNVVTEREMFTTTALAIILFTSLVQGGTIKKLVAILKVKQADPEQKDSLVEMVMTETISHTTKAMSHIACYYVDPWYKRMWKQIHPKLNKYLMVSHESNVRTMKIVARTQQIMISEAVTQIKKFGSYRMLSAAEHDTPLSTSKSVPSRMAEASPEPDVMKTPEMPRSRFIVERIPVTMDTIGPRKESLRTIFRGATVDSPSQSLYSRHFMSSVNQAPSRRPLTPLAEVSDPFEDENSARNALTFPNNEIPLKELRRQLTLPTRKRLDSEPTRPSILPCQRSASEHLNRRPKFNIGTLSPNDSDGLSEVESTSAHDNLLSRRNRQLRKKERRIVFNVISEDEIGSEDEA